MLDISAGVIYTVLNISQKYTYVKVLPGKQLFLNRVLFLFVTSTACLKNRMLQTDFSNIAERLRVKKKKKRIDTE